MRALFVGLCFALVALEATGQTIGQKNTPDSSGTYTLSVRTQLVIETVAVKDKQGNPVNGLEATDFSLREDGVPQTIRFCLHQVLSKSPLPAIATDADDDHIRVYRRLSRTQITSDTPESGRYKNRRLIALYFDMSAMRPEDQLRALEAADRFVRTQLTEADMVSVLRYQGGSVDVLQDFTGDRDRLLSILHTLVVGEGQGSAEIFDDATAVDNGAAFGQDDGEFNVFNTDRQLSALETAAKMLGRLNEKKSLIYFAGGLRLNGLDNEAQLHATVDAAIRAGVSFWPIDARGLVAQAPLGDASQGSVGNIGAYNGAAAEATTTGFQQSQDTLFALAEDTGGKAFFDYNDLTRGMVRAQQAISDYYILEYYTTNSALDGRFRRIKVTLNSNPTAKLEFRQGYYSGKEFGKFTAADKERQLEDALMLEDPIMDLTIAMDINYFQLNHAEYFVPIVVKIPGRELSLAKRGGADYTLIDFVGEIKDANGGMTISNVRDNVRIKLSDATAAELAHNPIEYDTGFTLLPGNYMIKFIARDNETGRIGTYEKNFAIPNLNVSGNHVPISSVVLSSQRVDYKGALYNAGGTKDQVRMSSLNPLVRDGRKLIPSVTRVFNNDRDLYVYLQAYEATTKPSPLIAFVGLYRDQIKVFETQLTSVLPRSSSNLNPVSLSFDIALGHFSAGNYECQVTVLDPNDAKATFWRAAIELVDASAHDVGR